jgi:pyruvate dehydrogenase E1 component
MADPQDIDPQETDEWLASIDALIEIEGVERAHYIMERLIDKARRSGAYLPYSANTAYINTIPPHKEQYTPGDPALEGRIRSGTPPAKRTAVTSCFSRAIARREFTRAPICSA